MANALTPSEIDELTDINVVATLDEYNDCIVVGNKNLSDITEELQCSINKVNSAVEACLSLESSAISEIEGARAALLAAASSTPSSTSP